MNKQSTEDFQVSENILYDIIMMDICHYTFAETYKMYNTKSECEGKLWTLGDYVVSMQVHPWYKNVTFYC